MLPRRVLDPLDDLPQGRGQCRFGKLEGRATKTLIQIIAQRCRVIADQNRANAMIASSHENQPQRTWSHRKPDLVGLIATRVACDFCGHIRLRTLRRIPATVNW